jgi:glycosyltransferase involved in cell wall biosynthesis
MSLPRLLLADRIKAEHDSFLRPLLPCFRRHFEVRFVSAPPGDTLAAAIAWSDLVWLEWCWDHAVWATQTGVLENRPCVLRLHSIEALQTDYPARVDWSRLARLILVGPDIADVVAARFPEIMTSVPVSLMPNGIDLHRFTPGSPDRFRIGWVGHVEPKKNPMLLLQIAHRLHALDARYSFHVAGAFTDLRTLRYLRRQMELLRLQEAVRFEGPITDMPTWYADKGVLLSTSMYESFGMAIGEGMAVGCYPVIHHFPGAEHLWPPECLFSAEDEAVALIRSARPNLYRDWVTNRYSLERQAASVLSLLAEVQSRSKETQPSA